MIKSSFTVIPTRLYNTILLSFPLRAGAGVKFLFCKQFLWLKSLVFFVTSLPAVPKTPFYKQSEDFGPL